MLVIIFSMMQHAKLVLSALEKRKHQPIISKVLEADKKTVICKTL